MSERAGSTSPTLSVVVCTHNRHEDLERCLEALAALDEAPEVIVVDSASDPPCRALVERYWSRLPGLVYVHEPKPGLSRARNRGVSHANGEIVAFVDDDAAPRADWAREIVKPFVADASIGCVGGACLATFEDGVRRPRWLSDRLLQFAGITRFGHEARQARSSAEWPFGANIAFRASVLEAPEPFPEQLGRNGTTLLSGEEYALVERLRAAAWTIWLEPRAIVDHTVHRERCRSRYYWRRLWWAGVSRARATDLRAGVGLRLVVAAPTRLVLFAVTRDRVHLYRCAETAGFLAERTRLRWAR
jgi:glycosyltransferase involved in cell wall biosynthesis